ncbi:MAG TPA: methionyl-tRNA formyltransferase [Usitatibacter sp.]|nr:methionyl-tRNA formyltransferase [Usitatibacter sp.]
MRVAFAGTPPFAARALEALAAAGHEIPLVLTRPDSAAGRGLNLAASAVGQVAASRGFAVSKPRTLREAAAREPIEQASPDVMVVAAYGLILPPEVLAIPRLGCINIHASLLPRWRGAAPIQRALLAGDARTGVSIMRMDEGLDTGPVLLEKAVDIGPRETGGSLTARLADLGAQAIVEALAGLGKLAARAQDGTSATYAAKVEKAEALIDWRRPAAEIDRQVRAFDPAPGASTRWGAESLKVWSAEFAAGQGEPGTVLEASNGRLVIAAGAGALALTGIQKAGGRRLSVADFLRGTRISPGTRLETTPSAV